MIDVIVDDRAIEYVPEGARSVGELLQDLVRRLSGRVWISAVLNGWQRIDPTDDSGLSLPLEALSRLEVETVSVSAAVDRALGSVAEAASAAAALSLEAGEAYRRGDDAAGNQALLRLSRLLDDLALLLRALSEVEAAPDAAATVLDLWTGRCAAALSNAVRARESGDLLLLADHLLYDLEPAARELCAAAGR